MAQNLFPKALLQEVLADSEQNLERAILPEHMFGDDGDESESAESLVDDEGAVDEVEDFMVPAQAALGIGLQKDFSFADEVAEAKPHSDDTDDDSADRFAHSIWVDSGNKRKIGIGGHCGAYGAPHAATGSDDSTVRLCFVENRITC